MFDIIFIFEVILSPGFLETSYKVSIYFDLSSSPTYFKLKKMGSLYLMSFTTLNGFIFESNFFFLSSQIFIFCKKLVTY